MKSSVRLAVTGNAITVYDRTAVGTLRAAAAYSTGGLGGALGGSVVDHLASQGSLAYDGTRGLLYAVNAGSNTVTVFSADGDRLIRRQVVSSGGAFPVSIAVHGNLLYVLNARDGGSVHGSCGSATLWSRSLPGTVTSASTPHRRRNSPAPPARSRSPRTGRS
jgi:DNA-binding beta-propeller fold protein YncE